MDVEEADSQTELIRSLFANIKVDNNTNELLTKPPEHIQQQQQQQEQENQIELAESSSSRPTRRERLVRQLRSDLVVILKVRKEASLRIAVSTNNLDRTTFLLRSGVNPNSSDQHLRSPLHLAASRGYQSIIKVLLGYGADPNIKDSIGNTPLHLAACSNFDEVVSELISAGADVFAKDNNGRSAFLLAYSRLKLLRKRFQAIPENATRLTQMLQTARKIDLDLFINGFNKIKKDNSDVVGVMQHLQNNITKEKDLDRDLDINNLLSDLETLSLG